MTESGFTVHLTNIIEEFELEKIYEPTDIETVLVGSANLNRRQKIDCHSAVIIPAGTWHNIVNTGNRPLKLYSVYAPPQHPFGTVHRTKTDAV